MSYSLTAARKHIEGMENPDLGKYRDFLNYIQNIEGKSSLSAVPTSVKLRLVENEITERTQAVNFFNRYDHRSH